MAATRAGDGARVAVDMSGILREVQAARPRRIRCARRTGGRAARAPGARRPRVNGPATDAALASGARAAALDEIERRRNPRASLQRIVRQPDHGRQAGRSRHPQPATPRKSRHSRAVADLGRRDAGPDSAGLALAHGAVPRHSPGRCHRWSRTRFGATRRSRRCGAPRRRGRGTADGQHRHRACGA